MTNQTVSTDVQVVRQSKITADQVIAMRTLKAQQPDLTVAQIKEITGCELSTMAIGRTLRGILHSQVDMCGLPVTAMKHNENIARRIERKEERKAERDAKKAARAEAAVATPAKPAKKTAKGKATVSEPPTEPDFEVVGFLHEDEAGTIELTPVEQVEEEPLSYEVGKCDGKMVFTERQTLAVFQLAKDGMKRADIATKFGVSLSTIARLLAVTPYKLAVKLKANG